MAGMSKIPNTALIAAGACFATSIYIVYLLLRKAKEDLYEGQELIKSSRHTVIEVPVPSEIIGSVIGRNGSNIAKIQETTSTRINFRDEAKGSTSRVAIIRGKPNDAQAAERLIRSAVAERMNITSLEIQIPIKACGYIIGKNGTNVRMIREVSKAKIQMDSSGSGDLQKVIISGTKEEIATAKALIEEDVEKAMLSRQKHGSELSTSNRMVQFHGKQLCINSKADTDSIMENKPRIEELIPSGKDGFLEVWVSYITSPSQFWVQPVRENCTVGLDKLTDEMTSFYSDQSNDTDYAVKEVVNLSDLVAAPFTHDSDWYRARVTSVEEDEYDAENSQIGVYYVDYGEQNVWRKGALRILRDDFKQFPFQATECELADVRPKKGETAWSVEAIKAFDQLSYCSLWKKIMLRVLREGPTGTKVVELIDVLKDTDVDVADELVKLGLAEHFRPVKDD